ncbi:MAG: hypothetical protein EOM68_29925 [Spirochaetia bacterium]|nr:hypothetical protein [Spirochaetia bacterium]
MLELYKEKCPQVGHLYDALCEVMDAAGYPAGASGLWSGSTQSSSGCFVIGRQHPDTGAFRLVWYNHATGEVKMKDMKGSRRRFESAYDKVAQEVGIQ